MVKLTEDTPVVHADCDLIEADLGRFVEIGRGSRIAYSTFGDYSYCDRYADIANAEIGKFSNIASFVRIGATDHPLDRASLHHFMYRSSDYWEDADHDADWFARRRSRRAHIGHDTWIGHNAQIKPEVTIGHGAVVASGAIVTKDVPPYMIVAGVPAKPIRTRISPALADQMIALGWWDWSHEAIREALDNFRKLTAEEFLEYYG
jgi:phosphonate metabolism protein (transferase hexapeptide repeat family)